MAADLVVEIGDDIRQARLQQGLHAANGFRIGNRPADVAL
jgi:hypothetical protein